MAKKDRKNRIKVEDLPKNMKVTEDEMKHITGGYMLRTYEAPTVGFDDPIIAFEAPVFSPRGVAFEAPVF